MKYAIAAAAFYAIVTTTAHAASILPANVVEVAHQDVLNVRAWPASYSRVTGTFMPGDYIRLLGRCKNINSNVSFWISGKQSVTWNYNRMKAANVWCQALTRKGNVGWVRGKFVFPRR
jgi:uncharacterized protein YgiM (DUF1202 family)